MILFGVLIVDCGLLLELLFSLLEQCHLFIVAFEGLYTYTSTV
jgi:hypothetical protein